MNPANLVRNQDNAVCYKAVYSNQDEANDDMNRITRDFPGFTVVPFDDEDEEFVSAEVTAPNPLDPPTPVVPEE